MSRALGTRIILDFGPNFATNQSGELGQAIRPPLAFDFSHCKWGVGLRLIKSIKMMKSCVFFFLEVSFKIHIAFLIYVWAYPKGIGPYPIIALANNTATEKLLASLGFIFSHSNNTWQIKKRSWIVIGTVIHGRLHWAFQQTIYIYIYLSHQGAEWRWALICNYLHLWTKPTL